MLPNCKLCKGREYLINPVTYINEICPRCNGSGREENMISNKEIALKQGKSVVSKEPGNSMSPIIKSRQPVLLVPVKLEEVQVNDIVYCKVSGRYYTHLVKATDPKKGCQIGNNHGHINGWTKNVFGKVTKIYEEK